MDELREQGVGIYLHQQQVDTSTAAGRAFLQMAAVFPEFERSIIVERIHAGLNRARAHGAGSALTEGGGSGCANPRAEEDACRDASGTCSIAGQGGARRTALRRFVRRNRIELSFP
jgi:DNA invertase Pin-like site-specific DNA recombinase